MGSYLFAEEQSVYFTVPANFNIIYIFRTIALIFVVMFIYFTHWGRLF